MIPNETHLANAKTLTMQNTIKDVEYGNPCLLFLSMENAIHFYKAQYYHTIQ